MTHVRHRRRKRQHQPHITAYSPEPTDPEVVELAGQLERTPEEVAEHLRTIALIHHREEPRKYPHPGPGVAEPTDGMVAYHRDVASLSQEAFDRLVGESSRKIAAGDFGGSSVDDYRAGDLFKERS